LAIKYPNCHSDNPDTQRFCGDCGTRHPSLEKIVVTETIEAHREELTTGLTFAGGYQIIEELGKGVVWTRSLRFWIKRLMPR
jgi:hypothetical protein